MQLWHLTPDAPRVPEQVRSGEAVAVWVGTWPVEPGQRVWLSCEIRLPDGGLVQRQIEAGWHFNRDGNSYWRANLEAYPTGTRVRYAVCGEAPGGSWEGSVVEFLVRPRLSIALLWHQHQPLYRNPDHPSPRGRYRLPWVRLHALRDYYSKAALLLHHPRVHLTINVTPVLARQLQDYLEGATDRALDLTLTPARRLDRTEREELLATFFEAEWHHQIFPHPRYRELFLRRRAGKPFGRQDLRDLQMWANLVWFAPEFRQGAVQLVTGEFASVERFIHQERNFTDADIREMVDQQYRVLRAVIPLHRLLQDRGQIEISTTPYYHPILPLVLDTDSAVIDRPGSVLPARFQAPADAKRQVDDALSAMEEWFGQRPAGVWPAEGAVSPEAVASVAAAGISWLATDEGVLRKSGRWGYRPERPDVLCRPYRVEAGGRTVAVFFRHAGLSNAFGFRLHRHADPEIAASAYLDDLKQQFCIRGDLPLDRVLTLVSDGENPWGQYAHAGSRFLEAFYRLLENDADIQTVSFRECLAGDPTRGVPPHPLETLELLDSLATGSWIDETGSKPGVDLGTWIGKPGENRGWQLLGQAQAALNGSRASEDCRGRAREALLAAEGSDWFWWLDGDQLSRQDAEFDDLFRAHVKAVYRELALPVPPECDEHITPHYPVWAFPRGRVPELRCEDHLILRTHCPGVVSWRVDDGPAQHVPLEPTVGDVSGPGRFQTLLGPFPAGAAVLRFGFRCREIGCDGRHCCSAQEVEIPFARVELPAPAGG